MYHLKNYCHFANKMKKIGLDVSTVFTNKQIEIIKVDFLEQEIDIEIRCSEPYLHLAAWNHFLTNKLDVISILNKENGS